MHPTGNQNYLYSYLKSVPTPLISFKQILSFACVICLTRFLFLNVAANFCLYHLLFLNIFVLFKAFSNELDCKKLLHWQLKVLSSTTTVHTMHTVMLIIYQFPV